MLQTEARSHGHSDLGTVSDALRPQDVSTNQIWDSYLKKYKRYAPGAINLVLELRSRSE